METSSTTMSTNFLPKNIVDIFEAEMISGFSEFLKNVYQFSDEQIYAFEAELTVTLLGLDSLADFQNRAKQALQATDEVVLDVLDDTATVILTPDVMGSLGLVEVKQEELAKLYKEPETHLEAPVEPTPPVLKSRIPTPNTPPEPPKAPDIPVAPVEVTKLRETPKAHVPTGKMVGLKKEVEESSIKGMRTMRGDISRLRSEEGEEPTGSDFTKPFRGS